MESGLVFDIQRFSIHDGPGIRTTVFLKGCPLDCWWCHNPEGTSAEPQVIVLEGRCIRCGECSRVCPQGDRAGAAETCTLCGRCVAACPTGARQMVGRRMTVAEVVAEVLKDRVFYDESGGGATFSGGEPLVQPRFLRALLEACRAAGVRTAVDTCGYGPQEDLLALAPLADLLLWDLKFADEARHVRYTGVSNGPILENLRAVGRAHGHLWIRVPVIPGVNDDAAQLDALARCAASVEGVRQVNVLPYPEGGAAKSPRLGRAYRLDGAAPPAPGRMEEAAAAFARHGLKVKIGG
jgi:pyruvate formate lyase activating enzyme